MDKTRLGVEVSTRTLSKYARSTEFNPQLCNKGKKKEKVKMDEAFDLSICLV